jgi:hypothetical protein
MDPSYFDYYYLNNSLSPYPSSLPPPTICTHNNKTPCPNCGLPICSICINEAHEYYCHDNHQSITIYPMPDQSLMKDFELLMASEKTRHHFINPEVDESNSSTLFRASRITQSWAPQLKRDTSNTDINEMGKPHLFLFSHQWDMSTLCAQTFRDPRTLQYYSTIIENTTTTTPSRAMTEKVFIETMQTRLNEATWYFFSETFSTFAQGIKVSTFAAPTHADNKQLESTTSSSSSSSSEIVVTGEDYAVASAKKIVSDPDIVVAIPLIPCRAPAICKYAKCTEIFKDSSNDPIFFCSFYDYNQYIQLVFGPYFDGIRQISNISSGGGGNTNHNDSPSTTTTTTTITGKKKSTPKSHSSNQHQQHPPPPTSSPPPIPVHNPAATTTTATAIILHDDFVPPENFQPIWGESDISELANIFTQGDTTRIRHCLAIMLIRMARHSMEELSVMHPFRKFARVMYWLCLEIKFLGETKMVTSLVDTLVRTTFRFVSPYDVKFSQTLVRHLEQLRVD